MGWPGQCQERLLALAAFFAEPPGSDLNGGISLDG